MHSVKYYSNDATFDEAISFSRSPFLRTDCGTCDRISNVIEKQLRRGQCTRRQLMLELLLVRGKSLRLEDKKNVPSGAEIGLEYPCNVWRSIASFLHRVRQVQRRARLVTRTAVSCVLYLMTTVTSMCLECRTIYNFCGVVMEFSTVFHVSLVP